MRFEVEIILKFELFFSTFLTFKSLPQDPGYRDPTFFGLCVLVLEKKFMGSKTSANHFNSPNNEQ